MVCLAYHRWCELLRFLEVFKRLALLQGSIRKGPGHFHCDDFDDKAACVPEAGILGRRSRAVEEGVKPVQQLALERAPVVPCECAPAWAYGVFWLGTSRIGKGAAGDPIHLQSAPTRLLLRWHLEQLNLASAASATIAETRWLASLDIVRHCTCIITLAIILHLSLPLITGLLTIAPFTISLRYLKCSVYLLV